MNRLKALVKTFRLVKLFPILEQNLQSPSPAEGTTGQLILLQEMDAFLSLNPNLNPAINGKTTFIQQWFSLFL